MRTWYWKIQQMLDAIDAHIKSQGDEPLTLGDLAAELGYSEFYLSRKFREITGLQFRDYLRLRRLAFAFCDVRDSDDGLLDIAVRYGFSSHEAFTRAFKEAYGVTPTAYRQNPVPVVLRTIIRPFDCHLMEIGEKHMTVKHGTVKTYFVTIPAHKFLHIRNYESNGYFDFWQKQAEIPGCDCETICGLLHSIPDKLDDLGSEDLSSGSGQIMGFLNHPRGRICGWGIPLAECYGVRLPSEYSGPIPPQMQLMDVPEGKYIVFEHGPFDYKTDTNVGSAIEAAMASFDYAASGYELDLTPGRIFYFYHDPSRFWKYIRPVKSV
ncbi:MAG: helix-turn-helix transcriptional regulator [Clostridia bacterium]|nr:helix-turn-helix transcriptional regulator [Clostridia bacterium]